jgi:hypothetical protein
MAITSYKDIPNAVHDVLQQFYVRASPLFKRVKFNGEFLIRYIDSDSNSGFFFEITSFNVDTNNAITFSLNRAPQSRFNIAPAKVNLSSQVIDQHFSLWVEELTTFSKRKGVFEEDTILKQYAEEFFTTYELVDEDADTKSYGYEAQLKIDKFLEALNEKLTETKTEENKIEIEEIQQEVQTLKSKQTSLTKRVVFTKIANITAKCRKCGFEFGKWVLETFIKACAEATVKTITKGALPTSPE